MYSVTGGSSSDIITPLNQYLGGLCTTEPCSESTIQNATSIIAQSCASDLQSEDTTVIALYGLVENFNGFRDLLCTKYTGNGTYCIIDILETYQNATGNTLSLDPSALTSGGLNNVDPSIFCTDCGKAFITETLDLVQNITAGLANATSGTGSGSATASAAAALATAPLNTTSIETQLNQTLASACGGEHRVLL